MITSKSAQKRFAWDSVSMVKNSQWKNNKTIRKKVEKFVSARNVCPENDTIKRIKSASWVKLFAFNKTISIIIWTYENSQQINEEKTSILI